MLVLVCKLAVGFVLTFCLDLVIAAEAIPRYRLLLPGLPHLGGCHCAVAGGRNVLRTVPSRTNC